MQVFTKYANLYQLQVVHVWQFVHGPTADISYQAKAYRTAL